MEKCFSSAAHGDGKQMRAYWLDTSSNDLITEIVQELPFKMERRLHALLKGGISAVEDAFRERDPFLFGKYLAAYLKESVSFFDTAAFYKKNLVVCKDLPASADNSATFSREI